MTTGPTHAHGGTLLPDVACAGALVCVSLLVYAGTFSFPLVWDDLLILPSLSPPPGDHPLWHLLSIPLLPDAPYYRPVVSASLKADTLLAGLLPWNPHLTNALLHGLVAALVYALAIARRSSRRAAFLTGGLFAATPLHVEPVVFVSGRADLFMALFVLCAVLAWQAARGGPRAPAVPLAVFSACSLLALLSKETAVALPLLLVAWHLAERDRLRPLRQGASALLPWLLCWSACLAAAVALRRGAAGLGLPPGIEVGPNLLARMWLAYARLLAAPWPVASYYTPGNLPVGAHDLLLALALPLGVAAMAAIRKGRAGLTSLLWIAVFLLPVASLQRPPGAVISTRFLYLPSVGVSLLCASLLDLLPPRRRLRQAVTAAAVMLTAVMALGVSRASQIWSSELLLFEAQHRDAPDVPEVNYNLGYRYQLAGRFAEAAALYRKALALKPDYPSATFNLGVAALSLQDLDEAERCFLRLLRLTPRDHRVYNNLGQLRAHLGLWGESESLFRKAVELAPGDATGHVNLGLALEQLGRRGEAAWELRAALRIDPTLEDVRQYLRDLEQRRPGLSSQ